MQTESTVWTVFVGGQMEIQNSIKGRLYRGEIKSIALEDNLLWVRFVWLAKCEGFPNPPGRWIRRDCLDYTADLDFYAQLDIGDGCVCFNSPVLENAIILHPPNGSKLNPAKVEGLTL